MKTTLKRYSAALLAFVMIFSISLGLNIPAKAADVDYVYNGTYIYNWGNREELATFLSPKAEAFYDKNNVTLDELLALDGSSTEKNIPSSTLYKKLQDIMKSNHSYQTSYSATKNLYQYTDCQNSGKTSKKISSFYSGKSIGPSWDGSSWNREHTWPNSKGDLSGNGENDIMMLRPTASSENTSRGNKAYGEGGVSYYNPNSESGGNHDLRGDVARIMLYQYVRWACINTGSKYNPNGIFGSNGIIESKAIMLKWIEEDPVDTWELGRNDSVQSITGTRNVFVDFPELAFDLFNEDIPNGYKSPSSSTTSSGYKITATANNSAWGKVSVTRNTVSAYASNGYEAVDYTIVSGKATVERIGDDFKVTTSGDVTIQINFAPTVKATFVENGETTRTLSTHKDGKVTLPSIKTGVYTGNSFLGWVTAKINETEKKPAVLAVGDKYSVAGNTTLYALYSAKKNGKTVYSTSAISAGASAGNTSSKNEQVSTKPSSKPSGAASSKPSSTTSKPSDVTTSKPSSNTSSKGEQNVDSKPIGDNNSVENEQNTSSILTETEDVFVTVNISEDTVVVSDFIEEAINNNIPLVLKAKDYTWNFEKIAMPLEDVRNFNAAILSGDEVAKEDKAVVKKAAGGKKFYAFDFAYEGNLPAKAVITMRVDDAFAGKTVEIYSLTPSGSKILEGTATVSSDSVLRFKTERTSLMFITDADAKGGASLLWLWILIAVVVLGGAAAVFVVLYKREAIMTKNKQDLA